MEAITIQWMLDGMVEELARQFPNIPVTGEQTAGEEQEAPSTRLLVRLESTEQQQELGRRYRRMYSFDLQFTHENQDIRAMHDMMERLYQAASMIELNGRLFRGVETRHEIQDGIAHFRCSIPVWMRQDIIQPPAMQNMNQEGRLLEKA